MARGEKPFSKPESGTGYDNTIFTPLEWREIAGALSLSPRELQIVQGVFDDAKEVSIAHRLDISRHTVHTYLERIYRKLDVKSRGQMMVRVMAEYLEMTNGLEA